MKRTGGTVTYGVTRSIGFQTVKVELSAGYILEDGDDEVQVRFILTEELRKEAGELAENDAHHYAQNTPRPKR